MPKPRCVVHSFGSNGRVTFEEAVVDITHKHCEVHVFDFTLSGEQAHEVEATEGVLFQGYGIGADDEIVNGRFQCENGVVTSYELKTLPTLMKESGHDCNGTRSSHVHVQQCVTHMVRHSRHCNQGHCLNRDTPSDYQLTDQSQASLRYTTIA